MEEQSTLKASSKSSHRRSSEKDSLHPDIRNRWTMASLSHSQMEVRDAGDKTRRRSSLKGRWKDDGESVSLKDKVCFKPEEADNKALLEMEMSQSDSLQNPLEMEEDSQSASEQSSSLSLQSISKHTPHRAYLAEQQNRLPLPLMELMEKEVLEILTKALRSYRSVIGRDHFMTKELQRYVEGLKRRRNKRMYCMF